MKRFLQRSLIGTAIFCGIYLVAALVMIVWPAPSFAAAPFPVEDRPDADFTPRYFTARDGETLFARHFPAASETTILLLHGVTLESAAFNVSGPLLRQVSGAGVVALDLRGHGQSGGVAGNVDSIGQYEDNVADVIAAVRREQPGSRVPLAGHSMGGGIALRFARLEDAPPVDGYLLFASHLGTSAPTIPELQSEMEDFVADYTQLHVPLVVPAVLFLAYSQFIAPLSIPPIDVASLAILLGGILLGAFGEELGWRGYAQNLLEREQNGFVAILVVGVLWGVWHIGNFQYGPAYVLFFIFSTIGYSAVLAWLLKGTRYNVILATLFHFGVNVGFYILQDARDDLRLVALNGLVWMGAALIIVVLDRQEFVPAR